jgi:Rap1a immunity proteins
MTCGELKDRIEDKVADPSFSPSAELLGVVATHGELCTPSGTTLAKLTAVFVRWGDANPELMNMPSRDCIARAFAEAFQCTQPEGGVSPSRRP